MAASIAALGEETEYFEGPEKTLEVWFVPALHLSKTKQVYDSATSLSVSQSTTPPTSPETSRCTSLSSSGNGSSAGSDDDDTVAREIALNQQHHRSRSRTLHRQAGSPATLGNQGSSSPASCYSSMDESDDQQLVAKLSTPKNTRGQGLRAVPIESWVGLLKEVQCTILSTTSNDAIDSYVLSESSMFITPYRFILKTCGTTTLLRAVPILLRIAAAIGLTDIQDFFFSRRHLGRPELQQHPHTSFREEVDMLDSIFSDGSAHVLGRVNGDHWYLYQVMSPEESQVADQTLELLMADLDPAVMANFYKSSTITSVKDVHAATGIDQLFPTATLDAYLFDPCGYSVNGLIGEHYFTIHVTPQEKFSFVSFETDVPLKSYTELINHVCAIFRPGRFCINLFFNKPSRCAKRGFDDAEIMGYRRRDKMLYQFEKYKLNFGHFDSTSTRRPAAAQA